MTYELILSALADPTRRSIFEDLRSGPMPVSRLADNRTVSRPAVSQHLRVLENAGLVNAEARGTARHYSIRREGIEPLRSYLDEFWDDALRAFADEVQNQMEKNDAGSGDKNN